MELVHIINQEGKAIPVKVVNGSTGGGITGKNIDTNEQISEVSFEVDDNGYPVLRVIDAAPYAFNPVENALDVNIKQNSLKLKRETYTATVNAGQAVTFATLDVSDYSSLSWGVKPDASSSFKLTTSLSDFETGNTLNAVGRLESPLRETFTSASSALTKPIELQTTGVKLSIINDDSVAHTYTAYVYMRKG